MKLRRKLMVTTFVFVVLFSSFMCPTVRSEGNADVTRQRNLQTPVLEPNNADVTRQRNLQYFEVSELPTSLRSRTTDGLENIGNITFDGITYTLPNSTQKEDGLYLALANPPGSYSFHHWECSGGVSINPAEKYSNPVQVSISGNGELRAIFFLDIHLYFSQGEEYFPTKGLDFDHDGYINFNAWIVRNFPEWNRLEDLDGDGINDAPAYVYAQTTGSYRIIQYWLYYAFDNKEMFSGLLKPYHEHDFESIFVWVKETTYVVERVSLNQHLWANNYENALTTYYGSPPTTIHVAVEKGGHGMILLTSSSDNFIKPDNSEITPDILEWSKSSLSATLYTWKIYDGLNPTDDGFGDSSLLRTGANYQIMEMFGRLLPGIPEVIWLVTDVRRSLDEPILLESNEPYFTIWRYISNPSQQVPLFIQAPWTREEFSKPQLRWEKVGFSRVIEKSVLKSLAKVVGGQFSEIMWKIYYQVLGVMIGKFDPIDGSIVDEGGNITGYKEGAWVNEIVGGIIYWKTADLDIYFVLGETEDCGFTTQSSTFAIYNSTFEIEYFNSSISFDATEIPILQESVHSYEIDWNMLKAGQNGTTVSVDIDGDGVIEQSWQVGTTLTSDDMLRVRDIDTGFGFVTIQEAINSTETLDGHTILVDAGTYYEHLVINKSLSLVGENENTTIIDGNLNGTVIRIMASNVNISGFTIRNSGSSPNCGIYMTSSGNNISCNIIVNNSYGIRLIGSSGNSIVGNNITANDNFGIYFFSSSNSSIIGNNITNNGYGIYLESSSSNSISGNNITANDWYGISLYSSSNNIISGNTFANDGLLVWGSYQNSVEDNTVNGRPLVYLEGVSNYTVDDAGQVVLVRCDNIRVEGLDLSRTNIGIELSETSNSIISGNNITANNWNGIHLYDSSSNSIIGNNITNNGYGIYLESSSSNSISGNNITANDWYGISLYSSSNNIVSGNNITTNNRYGIRLISSSSNKIVHNNFVNSNNVYRSGSVNVWDNGYPSCGNYWSDYGGADVFSGTYQNETGSDGIVDTPYIMDANNTDRYPLIRPWGPLLGDANGDGTVDVYDLIMVASAYGSTPVDPNWNPSADINGDGTVDIYDLILVASHYGESWS